MVSQKLVEELQQIIKQRGTELSSEEAAKVANQWVGYFRLLGQLDRLMQNDEQQPNNNE